MTAYVVVYPSAARDETAPLHVTGRLVRLPGLSDLTLAIVRADGSAVVLDPRALVFDAATSACVYSPPAVPGDELAPWVRAWLTEHPRWGMPGCEHDWAEAGRPRGEAP